MTFGRGARSSSRVLVIEDTEAIRLALDSALTAAGHRTLSRPDGSNLERDLTDFRPDVVVLDVMLPGRDGFMLLEAVRARTPAGVLMLTARDGIDDRLRGLTAGADDYVVKPFILAELVARVNALLRRMGCRPDVLVVGDLTVDPQAAQARRSGQIIEVTATEFKVLHYLAENRGVVVTKTQILSGVWGFDAYDPNLVEVHISGLRRKLEEYGPRLLHTVRGFGYVLRIGDA